MRAVAHIVAWGLPALPIAPGIAFVVATRRKARAHILPPALLAHAESQFSPVRQGGDEIMVHVRNKGDGAPIIHHQGIAASIHF